MWKRKRWNAYSNIVQRKLPRKKQSNVLTNAPVDTRDKTERGNRGAARKVGIGMVNCDAERRKRLTAMGIQNRGTTYHVVRVHN